MCEVQQHYLERYLAQAIKCEKKETAVKNVVTLTIGNTHSFYAKVFTALGLPEPDKEAVANGTYLSACEKTLAKYAGDVLISKTLINASISKHCWVYQLVGNMQHALGQISHLALPSSCPT